MAKASQITITFKSQKPGANIEFVAVATGGIVTQNKVTSIAATYQFEKSLDTDKLLVTIKKKQSSTSEFSELGSIIAQALYIFNAMPEQDPAIPQTNLTPVDLLDIWQALAQQTKPIQTLLKEPDFESLFPYADLLAGTYESLRHKSGCVIKIETRKDGIITSHSIDAPSPVLEVKKQSQSIYVPDGYLGTNESRWRISKILGSAPAKYKAQVFAWAADAIHMVEEFHNTHGGVSLPENFEFRYDNVHLTFDRDLRFEQKIISG